MSNTQIIHYNSTEKPRSAAPTWWIVLMRELSELWYGGKALFLILIYSVLLGIWSYVLASNSELSLIPPKEMVFEMLKAAIAVSIFICLIIGADSISGERERSTLEGLLLAPVSRRQIVIGKFLAAVSPWPVAFVVTIPYWMILAQGDEVFGQAIVWGGLVGTLLAPAFAGIGVLCSLWSNSNKTSMLVSLGLFILLLLPTQLPATAQTGVIGLFVQQTNPMTAASHFLSKIMISSHSFADMWPWFVSPAILSTITIVMLFFLADSLCLESGKLDKIWTFWSRTTGMSAVLAIFIISFTSSAVVAEEGLSTISGKSPLEISIDTDYRIVNAGTPVFYKTSIKNNSLEKSPPLTVAMNIINLDAAGEVVDPEDWSPQRTQYLSSLSPGASAEHSWRINPILDGDYMVYMVVIPEPESPENTSIAYTSAGIHLTVSAYTKLNPAGVLPLALGGPILLLFGTILLYRLRHRKINYGADS